MVDIAFAPPEEREEIARFMHEVFPRAKWPLEKWRSLLARRWPQPADHFAVTARDGGRLVGVLGMLPAERPTTAGVKLTVNLTSWYLFKPYRSGGVGSEMMRMAGVGPAAAVTNFSSARGAAGAAERAGMIVLDSERLLWRPRPSQPRRLPVHTDPAVLNRVLGEGDRRILADHAGLNLCVAAVETPDGFCPLVYVVKRKHDDYVTHEVLYAGDHGLLARHARAIAEALLPPEGAVLSVDRRFLPPDMEADAVQPIPVPRYYIPGDIEPAHVDYLYSEIVLLDMKMS